jgi:hypothetical protein
LEISAIKLPECNSYDWKGSLLVGLSARIHRLSPARYHDLREEDELVLMPTRHPLWAFKFDDPHQMLRSTFEGFESEPGTRGNSSGCTYQGHHEACPSVCRPCISPVRSEPRARDVVTSIIRVTTDPDYRMLFILCAAAGLRFGEALGLDISNISPDRSTPTVKQKAWKGVIHDYLKGGQANGRDKRRLIDLHSSVAALLREYIRSRESGLVFNWAWQKPSQTDRQTTLAIKHPKAFPPSSAVEDWMERRRLGIRESRCPCIPQIPGYVSAELH